MFLKELFDPYDRRRKNVLCTAVESAVEAEEKAISFMIFLPFCSTLFSLCLMNAEKEG
jgi:hypothetical protein